RLTSARSTQRALARVPGTARLARGLVLGVLLLAGCDKGLTGTQTPDFSGLWDITYDDSLDVEVQLGTESIGSDTLGEEGGQVSLRDASASSDLSIDCERPELVCPAEVWPRELVLSSPPGQLDPEGVQLAQALAGTGKGRCAALDGSVITGEVMTVPAANAARSEAVALTSGRIRLVFESSCFLGSTSLPTGSLVVLTAGYTAAKR
ncbi:MAG: hypothetical protein JWN04_4147, partial [Myxococcaceae bacterium]|nr:hypothetical protein [Myxococcaceae bacterium]